MAIGADLIGDAILSILESDMRVVVLAPGALYDPGVFFGTLRAAQSRMPERLIEMPLCDASYPGICAGLAMEGMIPILCVPRADFLLLMLDQLANHAAAWHHMSGVSAGFVVRAVIGQGWGQGPQHAQLPIQMLSGFPGIEWVMPRSAWECAWLLTSSAHTGLRGPLVILESRSIHREAHAGMSAGYRDWRHAIDEWDEPQGRPRLQILTLGPPPANAVLQSLTRSQRYAIRYSCACRLICHLPDGIELAKRIIAIDPGHACCGWAEHLVAAQQDQRLPIIEIRSRRRTPTPAASMMEAAHYPSIQDLIDGDSNTSPAATCRAPF